MKRLIVAIAFVGWTYGVWYAAVDRTATMIFASELCPITSPPSAASDPGVEQGRSLGKTPDAVLKRVAPYSQSL